MTGKKKTAASLARIPGVVNGANGNDHRSNKPVVTNVTSQLIQKHFCSISSQAFFGIKFNSVPNCSALEFVSNSDQHPSILYRV
jgi:predicted secreted protein